MTTTMIAINVTEQHYIKKSYRPINCVHLADLLIS